MRCASDRSSRTSSAPKSRRLVALSGSRTSATTVSPRSRSALATAPPTNPPAPVITIRLIAALRRAAGCRSVDRRVGSDRFEPGLYVAEECRAAGAVVGPVIDAQDHVHDRPDRDDIAVRGGDDDRPLRDG